MPSYDYTTLWEAFAGGEGWTPESYNEGAIGSQTDFGERTESFYQEVLAPSFGAEEFTAPEYFSSFSPTGMEQAEQAFKLSTGDIFQGQDPYDWERFSRFSPGQAQEFLEENVYGATDYLGGEIGTTYKTDITKAREGYTSGVRGVKETLSYGSLMGDVSRQSGTSGAALRTGSGTKMSENILEEAYKTSKTLGSIYLEDLEESKIAMETSLDTALGTYLSSIDREKESWFQNVMQDVAIASGQGTLEGEYEGEYIPPEEWSEEFEMQGDYQLTEGCDIGELWHPLHGCMPYEDYTPYEGPGEHGGGTGRMEKTPETMGPLSSPGGR